MLYLRNFRFNDSLFIAQLNPQSNLSIRLFSTPAMPPTPSALTIRLLRHLVHRQYPSKPIHPTSLLRAHTSPLTTPTTLLHRLRPQTAHFSSTPRQHATYNQVRRGCRVEQMARKPRSPALVNRPEMKGVCLKTGTTKPKKPNSGERKIARIRLSSGRVVTAYIPGEGI